MTKTALITGITGQDGYYLSKHLLSLGYNVHGLKQHSIADPPYGIDPAVVVHNGDMTDGGVIMKLIHLIQPHEVYNLAAMTDVEKSFHIPEYTAQVNALGLIRIVENVLASDPAIRVYQAGTSEMFGNSSAPQNEETLFSPESPYAVSKLFAHHIAVTYRNAYNLFIANGILFNHESPLRGENFVTRKITRGLVRVKLGLQDRLYLGNLDAKRDWGYAGDSVKAMHLILQHDEPDDFVIATGKQYSVREFVNMTAECLGMDLSWSGEGLKETTIDWVSGKIVVEVRSELYRPNEVHSLCGDAAKAKEILGWEPETTIEQLVEMMVKHDYDLALMET